MTNERAAQALERLTTIPGDGFTFNEMSEAMRMGANALRAQQEQNECTNGEPDVEEYEEMTIEEAIKHCEEVSRRSPCTPCEREHMRLAAWLTELVSLRAQQKQPNKPLTYEQLQQMDGEPVYITGKHLAPSWDIVAIDYDHDWPIVYFHYKYRGALQRNGYGKTWRAYRRKPEQEEYHDNL